jgi:CheY-like chemotaxis protein
MGTRNRALIAAQPGAWTVLLSTLEDVMELVPVHSRIDALQALKHGPAIDVIISTIAFDDSQMIAFLKAVKQDRNLSGIPFLCSRVLADALPDRLVGNMRELCKQCGAADLVDVAGLAPEQARSAFRAAVRNCLRH